MEQNRPQAYVGGMNSKSNVRDARDEAQRREALDTLRTLNEGDTFATSALARTAQRATDHFTATDAGEDRIERWGRRIGRGLSLVALVALAIYLYVTYGPK